MCKSLHDHFIGSKDYFSAFLIEYIIFYQEARIQPPRIGRYDLLTVAGIIAVGELLAKPAFWAGFCVLTA
jgi:hypothetical protein